MCGALRERLWQIMESEGKTLAALNASLFAGRPQRSGGRRILEIRRDIGAKVIRTYCIAKGVAVALNPVPVADLVAAAAVDVGHDGAPVQALWPAHSPGARPAT